MSSKQHFLANTREGFHAARDGGAFRQGEKQSFRTIDVEIRRRSFGPHPGQLQEIPLPRSCCRCLTIEQENFELVDRLGKSTADSLFNLGDIYANEELVDLAVDAAMAAYGGLLGNAARDRQLVDWLHSHYQNVFP